MRLSRTVRYIVYAGLLCFATFPAYSDTLTWVGCGITKKAFMAELSKAYQRETGTEIQLSGGGATKGIRQVAANKVDIGGSCRNKLWGYTAERSVQFHPVAWDALVVITHKKNPVNDISLEDLRAIYKGKITNWKLLGGTNQPIELLIRKGKISGVGHAIREYLFAAPNMEFASDNIFPSSGPLEQAVGNNLNSLAITGVSSARKRNVKILKLEGKSPSYENIKSGAYLLYRPLYLVTNLRGTNRAKVMKFIQFANSPLGREVIRHNGVVPYMDGLHLAGKLHQQQRASRKMRLDRLRQDEN
jgi:phosphate transport system substrate-binding protein